MALSALNYAARGAPALESHARLTPWLLGGIGACRQHSACAAAPRCRPLVERCIIEHKALMEDAGVVDMIRETGYLKLFRTQSRMDEFVREEEEVAREFGHQLRGARRGSRPPARATT